MTFANRIANMKLVVHIWCPKEWDCNFALTCFNGGMQLAQAGGDLGVHLTLPGWLFRKGVSVGPKCLTDLHKVYVPHTCVLHDWQACHVNSPYRDAQAILRTDKNLHVPGASADTKQPC